MFYFCENIYIMKIGIDALAFDVAKLHLPIRALAISRNIEPEKLEKGLGLSKMTFPDVHQDSVVFAANALTKLIQNQKINLTEISRIYVGTESSVDASKPISSFLVSLMEKKFRPGGLLECDATDMTFACIGGVDALQNCLDFIALNPEKKAIVVTTDLAKYDLNSTGEYTQGAGAMAMLITANPRIIAFEKNWATSTKGVFDFFKPNRIIAKEAITGNTNNEPWFENLENEIEIHKEQPIFDGQYSNQCYMERIKDAYFMFKQLKKSKEPIYPTWKNIVMHLPYAYQGRRMLTEIYALDSSSKIITGNENPEEYQAKLKEISKSADYQCFVKQKLEPAEQGSAKIGNLYTSSIFMALLSTLAYYEENDEEIIDAKFGFLAYGSGSKSKVFEGIVQKDWKTVFSYQKLSEELGKSKEVSFETYEKLHKKEQKESISQPSEEWILEKIEAENPVRLGARYYKWISK